MPISLVLSTVMLLNIESLIYKHNSVLHVSISNYRMEIDKHLEEVEKGLESGNFLKACSHSTDAALKIKNHLRPLKRMEPNYNWQEMRKVLLEIPKIHCKEIN